MDKLRWKIAEIILGRKIGNIEALKHEWMKEQLEMGNSVTLEYSVTPIEKITLQ